MARPVRRGAEPLEPAPGFAARWRHSKKERFRPSEQFCPDVSAKRDVFWKAIAKAPFDNLIFIDKSGCNVAMTPSYGRALRGERVLDHKPASWGENLSVVGAIRADRILAHQTFEGAVHGPRFVDFVRRRLTPRLYPGDVVVLDNLRAHYAPAVRELVESAGARLVFLPPYSPDFSPIEPCWSFIKQWLRTQKERVPGRLKSAIVSAFQRVIPRHLAAWFLHCGYPFNRSPVSGHISKLETDTCVDPTRISVSGFSSGGGLAHRLGCDARSSRTRAALLAPGWAVCGSRRQSAR